MGAVSPLAGREVAGAYGFIDLHRDRMASSRSPQLVSPSSTNRNPVALLCFGVDPVSVSRPGSPCLRSFRSGKGQRISLSLNPKEGEYFLL